MLLIALNSFNIEGGSAESQSVICFKIRIFALRLKHLTADKR